MKKHFLFQIAIAIIVNLFAMQHTYSQVKKRVLFIGNSYVATNNLPNMLASIALSTGDTIIHDGNTPGGQTFMGHFNNATSKSKIAQGNWDYVVLQEQSQYPSFPINQVNNSVFPYAKKLDSLIHDANPCAKSMFYMTWGRKNGDDQNCPYFSQVCTYEGMDDLLRERYMMMAEQNNAMTSPIGPIWRYIRTNHPEIELYTGDGSHPSIAGTYAAACGFYASILRKDPTLITANSGLSQDVAAKIRNAAKVVVIDSLSTWKINAYDPTADFTFSSIDNTTTFTNQSTNATSYSWDFGDWTSSTEANPTHVYSAIGSYEVILTATTCNESITTAQTVNISSLSVDKAQSINAIAIFPNPATESISINGNYTTAQVIDATGRVLLTSDYSTILNLNNLDAGSYYIIFEHEGFSSTKQLIKN